MDFNVEFGKIIELYRELLAVTRDDGFNKMDVFFKLNVIDKELSKIKMALLN